MTIVEKQFRPLKTDKAPSGRTSKYQFGELKKAGQCLVFKLDSSKRKLSKEEQVREVKDLRKKISLSLTQWKKYNEIKWQTKARREGLEVCVYRIS